MRFMMFMCLPEGTREEDWNPAPEDVAAMTRYNEELRKAGMLLSLDGLHPPAEAKGPSVTVRCPSASKLTRAASAGMTPSSAMASAAWASMSNQMRNLVSGDQIAAISGRV